MNYSIRNTARLIGAGFRALLVLTLVTGVIYPLVVTGIAQGLFPDKANGSEVRTGGRTVGSELIGQTYTLPLKKGQQAPDPDLKWFQPRPSNGLSTNSVNPRYKLLVSGATNLSADSKLLIKSVKDAKKAVVEDNSAAGYTVSRKEVPADAVTSSASGLDPHISPEYAQLQAHRVAQRNKLPVRQVKDLVNEHTDGRIAGFLGERRVNVLELNVALEELAHKH